MRKSKPSKNRSEDSHPSYRLFDSVVGLASTLLENRKSIGADQLESLAKATQAYAASMTDFPAVQRQFDWASENIGIFAEYVLKTDIEHMVTDAIELARRRPLLAFVVSAAAGVAVTRLVNTAPALSMRASGKRRSRISKGARKTRVPTARSMNGSAHAHG